MSHSNDLFNAAFHGNLNQVKLFLSKGANPNFTDRHGQTPLYWAARNDRLDIVKELLSFPKGGANPNLADREGQTPLHLAVRNGHLEIVKELLIFGANPNIKGSGGWTSLTQILWRSPKNRLDIIKELLLYGADPNIRDSYGRTARQYVSSDVAELFKMYFFSLQTLSIKSIRKHRINISKLPPTLFD